MKYTAAALALLASTAFSPAFAVEGAAPTGIPHLDHVFVIMMENHQYAQIVGSKYMPFLNYEYAHAAAATNYFAVAHPSLTNYLEVVGGSNFNVLDDKAVNWGSTTCTSTLRGAPSNESSADSTVCPIDGTGMDAATPLIDETNETSGPPGLIEIDGKHSYPAAKTTGKTIADQIAAAKLTWKAYEESLPATGFYGVDTSNGYFSNNSTDLDATEQAAGQTPGNVAALYRSKHNPFVYFKNIQQAGAKTGSIPQIVSYEGATGLWADLATGNVPSFAYVVPNQCHDQHGAGNYPLTAQNYSSQTFVDVFCSNNTFDGGLRAEGDKELEAVIGAIKASPAWTGSQKTAIVVVWDENDYSVAPVTNKVAMFVDKNYGTKTEKSNTFYTHFSLLKSIEAGLGLPCLNHACDSSTAVMADLFN